MKTVLSTRLIVSEWIALAFAFLLAGAGLHADTRIIAGSTAGIPGFLCLFPVTLDTDTSVAGIQFDLVYNADIVPQCQVRDAGASPGVVLLSRQIAPGVLRVLAYASANTALNKGVVVEGQLSVSDKAAAGVGSIAITNLFAAGVDGNRIPAKGVDGNVAVFNAGIFHGVEDISWILGGDPAAARAAIMVTGPNTNYIVFNGPPANAKPAWNTLAGADGKYQINAVFQNKSGQTTREFVRDVVVNNAASFHSGWITNDQTWTAGSVHIVESSVIVSSNVTVTVEPGAIVKFARGASIQIETGAILNALGGANRHIVFTSLLDDEGGDTNFDNSNSAPNPGDWPGLRLALGAKLQTNEYVEFRYVITTHQGVIAGNEVWDATHLHHVLDDLTVNASARLAILPGAIVKFEPGKKITVLQGGELVADGGVAQPITFTSIRDDAVGGDTNLDGNKTRPSAGDWGCLFMNGGQGVFEHCLISYGGGPAEGGWGPPADWLKAKATLKTAGNSAFLSVSNSVIRESFYDGVLAWGGEATIASCVLSGIDRAVSAHPGSQVLVLNCTLYNNRIGLLAHGGTLRARNCIVSFNIASGIQYDFGTIAEVSHCDVWSPLSWASANYLSYANQTGKNGNFSQDPRFKDADRNNYRLNFGSPCIDAADGVSAPPADFAGAGRVTNPRSMQTGIPGVTGVFADMGAYEFVENAPSDVDLVVTTVAGPASVVAGDTVHVEWTVANRGTTAASGPWHDAIYLFDAESNIRILAGEVLAGQGTRLGPGQTYTASADIKAPGGLIKNYNWQVQANSQGEIFEGQNRFNNFTASVGDVALDLPEIVVNGPALTGRFDGVDDARLFKFRPASSKDVLTILTLAGGAGVGELYAAKGYVPGVQSFDFRQREWNSATVSTLAADADSNSVYYVLAYPRSLTSSPVAFNIRAATVDFGVEKILPSKVGNAGAATLEIFGANLRPGALFSLASGNGIKSAAIRTAYVDSGKVYATFPLTNFPAGAASIVVDQDGVTAIGTNLLQVVEGGSGGFYAYLTGPKVVRLGRSGSWYITYGNNGLIDVPLPLLRFRMDGAKEIKLFGSTLNWADQFVLLGLNDRSLMPSLAPGEEMTISVQVTPGNSGNAILELITGGEAMANKTAFNWEQIAAPVGANAAAWQASIRSLNERLGRTFADYYALLMRDMEALALNRMPYAYVANLNGQWLFGPEPQIGNIVEPIIQIVDEPVSNNRGIHPLAAAPPRKPADGIRKTYFVFLMDADYSTAGYGDRPGKSKDLDDLNQYARQELRATDDQIQVVHDAIGNTNDTMTAEKVLDAVRHFQGSADADDNLMIVYSGHGGRSETGTSYLALNGGSVSAAQLQQAINDVGAGSTYFINNACHSGGMGKDIQPTNTHFVGLCSTPADRYAWGDTTGSYFIKSLKEKIRKCNTLQQAFDSTQTELTQTYQSKTNAMERQSPELYNKDKVDLNEKPFRDPTGFWQQLAKTFKSGPFSIIGRFATTVLSSFDPNDKVGPGGAGLANFIGIRQVLPYTIYFENKPSASAPAQEVLVIDQLDANLDWSTFELKSIAFNDVQINVPSGLQQFTTRTNVSSDTNTVTVRVSFDTQTGLIQWLIRSEDAGTGMLPEDPYAGFLPPNDSLHRGEGALSYVVKAKASSITSGQIANQARIFFDPTYGLNQPIDTPTVMNTIDAASPTSRVGELPADSYRQFLVSWSGQDDLGGSGISSYDVFVSKDDGAFMPWLTATTDNQAVFEGETGASYRFYSLAHDLTGNLQTTPVSPFAVTKVTLVQPLLSASIVGNVFTLAISDIVPGRSYIIEQSASLDPGTWGTVKSFTADATAANFEIDITRREIATFFRVRTE